VAIVPKDCAAPHMDESRRRRFPGVQIIRLFLSVSLFYETKKKRGVHAMTGPAAEML
jgi:hypothetical protein